MNKIFGLLLLIFLPVVSHAEDIPSPNAEGMKNVLGIVTGIEHVDTSRRGSNVNVKTGNPGLDLGAGLIETIFGTNYAGFPIYHVKVSEAITIEVASRESFKSDDCVLVWYDERMGDSPNLSMLGQAGIAKSNDCNK